MAAPSPAQFHTDYLSSINEVKQWLSYKSLDEFIYLLLDHGYDDLDSLSHATPAEVDQLVALFSTPDSKRHIRTMVEAIRQLGIDVYRKQKSEFRRLIGLDDRQAKQSAIAEHVQHVRGQSIAVSRPSIHHSEASPSPASRASSAISPLLIAATAASAAPAASAAASAAAASTAAAAGSSSAPSTPSSAVSGSNPTALFDVATWDGSVHFQAYVQSIQCYARSFDEPILDAATLQSKLLAGRSVEHLTKIRKYITALVTGCVFKKFKRGSSAKRLIWASGNLDFLVWGTEGKELVKGYINTHDIMEVNHGLGAKNKNRFYVVSPERTLELEAKDGNQAKEWKEMLEMLIQLNMSEIEQKKQLQTGAGAAAFNAKFAKAKTDYTKLVSTGSVFKKWPTASLVGSFTTRLVWSPALVDRLQWGDIMNKKVMGFVLIQDIVEITESKTDKSKFTIFAQKRSLDLEARNEQTRERWIKALRFFIEFKQKAIA